MDNDSIVAILALLGMVFTILGWLGVVIAASRISASWAIACFLAPIAALVFGIAYWPTTRKPLILLVLGLLCYGAGIGWVALTR